MDDYRLSSTSPVGETYNYNSYPPRPTRYDYHGNEGGEGDHLSFLYDRAQGNSYSINANDLPRPEETPSSECAPNQQTPSSEYAMNDHGLRRATPAPAYPYKPSSSGVEESLACPTGVFHPRDAGGHLYSSGGHLYSTLKSDPIYYNGFPNDVHHQSDARHHHQLQQQQQQQQQPTQRWTEQALSVTDVDGKLSNLTLNNSSLSPSSPTSPSSSSSPSPSHSSCFRSNTSEQAMMNGGPAAAGQLMNGPTKLSPNHYNVMSRAPAVNHQNDCIPQNFMPCNNNQKKRARDINAARKFSVPVLSRPRIQVNDYSSSDDQLGLNGDRNQSRAAAEIDRSSVRQLLREGDEIGEYEQTSIRYTGKTNPSKVFRLLQTVTGLSDSESIEDHERKRRTRRRQKKEDEKEEDADDVVDISYIGGNIPSRTFRFLQEAIGERDQQAGTISPQQPLQPQLTDFNQQYHQSPDQPCRTVKVIHLRKQRSLDNMLSDF